MKEQIIENLQTVFDKHGIYAALILKNKLESSDLEFADMAKWCDDLNRMIGVWAAYQLNVSKDEAESALQSYSRKFDRISQKKEDDYLISQPV